MLVETGVWQTRQRCLPQSADVGEAAGESGLGKTGEGKTGRGRERGGGARAAITHLASSSAHFCSQNITFLKQ